MSRRDRDGLETALIIGLLLQALGYCVVVFFFGIGVAYSFNWLVTR